MTLLDFLKQNFSYTAFRGSQEEVIRSLIEGKDVLALMPTGQGKSLCFQFLAKYMSSNPLGDSSPSMSPLTLVISPLIALMQDQELQARNQGLNAVFLSSILSREGREQRQKAIRSGSVEIAFVTPERFRKPEFWDCLKSRFIGLMAVDEAHCISQWGHDFRPDYRRLGQIREELGRPRLLALTATATPRVQKEIQEELGFENFTLISDGLERPNIAIEVHEVLGTESKLALLEGQLQRDRETLGDGAVIIYAALIDTVQQISRFLHTKGISHGTYHGDLKSSHRRSQMQAFQSEANPLMVATPAFGLGIDKPNVRSIFHFEIPGSLEAYYQEIGRAGRDGAPAQAHLFFDEDDLSIQMEFIKWSHPDDEFTRRVYTLIEKNRNQIQQEGFDFLREQMSFKNRRDFRVEAAANILERWGCLERTSESFPFKPLRPPEAEDFLAEQAEVQFKHQNQKLLDLLKWCQSEETCRLLGIYEYFGHSGSHCGICDICRSK